MCIKVDETKRNERPVKRRNVKECLIMTNGPLRPKRGVEYDDIFYFKLKNPAASEYIILHTPSAIVSLYPVYPSDRKQNINSRD